jgi:type I restriction enzyme S subunit
MRALLHGLVEQYANARLSIETLIGLNVLASPQDGNHGEKHPSASDYRPDGIPFLMASDIRKGRADLAGCHFISPAVAAELRIGFAREGDVLLTHKGTIGQVAILTGLRTDYAMLTPQVTYYRTLDESRLSSRYLFYAFQSPDFQRQMLSVGRQSTRSYVGITAQRALSIPVPPHTVQESVVEKASAIEAAGESALRRVEAANAMRGVVLQALWATAVGR